MNLYLTDLIASLEAIEYKKDPILFRELTDIFERRRRKDLSKEEVCAAVAKSVKGHTNILIKLNIDQSEEIDVYVYSPRIDKNSPLLAEWSSTIREENSDYFTEAGMGLHKKKLERIGYVNRMAGTVHGAFEVLLSNVHITKELLDGPALIPEEIAAVILHELGHVFTSFETLGQVVSTNFALAALAERLVETKDIPRRVEILKLAQKHIMFKDLDIADASKIEKKDKLCVVLLDAKIREIRSHTGLSVYDENGWEFLSDQFATRQGAGRWLITGLDKLHRADGAQEYLGSAGRFFTYIMQILLTFFFSALTVGLFPIVMITLGFLTSPNGGTYDSTDARFKRVRNDMVNALKSPKLDRMAKADILEDIKVIDEITSKMRPFYGIWDWLYLNVYPKHKRELNQKTLEQELEKLGSNDLYIKAAQFANLH
jgi:hypothetical protein